MHLEVKEVPEVLARPEIQDNRAQLGPPVQLVHRDRLDQQDPQDPQDNRDRWDNREREGLKVSPDLPGTLVLQALRVLQVLLVKAERLVLQGLLDQLVYQGRREVPVRLELQGPLEPRDLAAHLA